MGTTATATDDELESKGNLIIEELRTQCSTIKTLQDTVTNYESATIQKWSEQEYAISSVNSRIDVMESRSALDIQKMIEAATK